jgi:hypothetical protein
MPYGTVPSWRRRAGAVRAFGPRGLLRRARAVEVVCRAAAVDPDWGGDQLGLAAIRWCAICMAALAVGVPIR